MTASHDQLDAAQSGETSADELRALARSTDPAVRAAVAAHPRTAPGVLAGLLGQVVVDLADEPESETAFAAGIAACCHAHTPLAAIAALLDDPDVPRDFRRRVARETPRRDVLELLANDRSGKVRKWAMTRLAEPG